MLSLMWILWRNAFKRGLHWKGTKCSKWFSVTLSRRKHRSFGGSLHSSVGKIVPPQVTWAKMWTNLAKPSTITEEIPFRRLLAFWASRREHASKLGGRTWIFGRSPHSVSASVAGLQAEAVADLRPPLEPRLLTGKQNQPGRYKQSCVSHSSLITLFGPLWFLLISRNEITVTRALFAGFHWNVWKIAESRTYDSRKPIPVVLPAVVEMLDPFHKLWRRQITNNKGMHIFYCCTVHFDIYKVNTPTNALFIRLDKVLKFTLKITLTCCYMFRPTTIIREPSLESS